MGNPIIQLGLRKFQLPGPSEIRLKAEAAYEGARWYNPATGTFISLDPLLETSSPLQLNGYTYAAANPVDGSDPTGQFCINQNACWDPLTGTLNYNPTPSDPDPGPNGPSGGGGGTSSTSDGGNGGGSQDSGGGGNPVVNWFANNAGYLGWATLNGAMAVGGALLADAGAAGEFTGTAACVLTVVGCAIGIPLDIAGAGAITAGTGLVVAGGYGLGKDITAMANNSGGSGGSGGSAEESGAEEQPELNLVKANARYVEKVTGENPELIKREIVGNRGSLYDLYEDKNTGDLYVLRKGGGGEPQPTGLRLP